MIFVITGTEKFPFNRFVQKIDELKEKNILTDNVLIQLGSCTYIPKNCTYKKWLNFDEVSENIKKASLVIAHAGAGTTLLCLELGQKPIIVTRRKEHNEHIDNHQVIFAKNMDRLEYAFVAYHVDELEHCLKNSKIANKSDNKFIKNNKDIIAYLDQWCDLVTSK